VTVTVVLTASGGLTVTLPFTVGGTAALGSDHDLADGVLTFLPGETMRTLTFAVVDDALIEPAETVVITLDAPQNATSGIPAVHTVTLLNDDVAPPPRWEVYLPLTGR
jgi:hypothetical protein